MRRIALVTVALGSLVGLRTVSLPLRAEPSPGVIYHFLEETCDAAFDVRGELKVAGGKWPEGEARLAFGWQEEDHHDYMALGQGRAAFFQVRDGQAQALGPAGTLPPLPPQGTLSVTLKYRPGRMSLVCNGITVIRAFPISDSPIANRHSQIENHLDSPFAIRHGGRLAVGVTTGDLEWGEVSYQPIEPVWFADDFMRSGGQGGEWEPLCGDWRVQGPGDDRRFGLGRVGANPFRYEGHTEGEAAALTAVGYWFWDDYTVSAAVRPRGEGAVGLCAYLQDAENYFLFRWTVRSEPRSAAEWRPDGTLQSGVPDYPQGTQQLVKVWAGRETVLAETLGGYQPNQWYRLALRVFEGQVAAFVDEQQVLAAEDPAFGQGLAGLYVGSHRAEFDDVQVEGVQDGPLGPDYQRPRVPLAFVTDPVMHSWATEAGWWTPLRDGFWHQGDFFSDPGLRFPLPERWPLRGRLRAALAAAEPSFDRGYVLDCTLEANRLRVELRREGQWVASAGKRPSAVPRPAVLIFRQVGAEVLASVGGAPWLTFRDAQPLAGRKVGFRAEGWPLEAADVVPFSPNLLDCAFAEAPVEFRVQRGTWDVMQRWVCWGRSHFGGGDAFSPLIWTKRDFAGDLTVAFYAANGPDPAAPPPSCPRDLNVTLCGDGLNVGSGYSFVVGGWDGSRCALFRRGEKVAESDMLPANRSPHTDWWAVRAQKQGNRLALYVDDTLLVSYTDPEPLAGGKVAFWTVGGHTLVLGRVRIWYERAGPWEPFPPRPSPPQSPQLGGGRGGAAMEEGLPRREAPEPRCNNDFEVALEPWTARGAEGGPRISLDGSTASQGERSLRVENTESGGPFAVWITQEPFDAARYPRLRFDYQVPPEVKVNLYARIGPDWHEITFTGEGTSPRRKVLGRIAGVQADGRWHQAEFDLLGALRTQNPEAEAWVVRGLALASPHEPYLRAGLTGNPCGAVYHLDGFALDKAPET